MEWVRDKGSFSSDWLLYRDSNHPTRGRYVFAPASAPHYEGLHNLWSKSWVSDEFDGQPPLGEKIDAQRKWDNGEPMSIYPAPIIVGKADCIHRGEVFPGGATDDLIGGFPVECYIVPPSQAAEETTDLRDCHAQAFFASVQEALYQGDGSSAVLLLQTRYPVGVVSIVPNSGSQYPGSVVVTTPDETIVVVSGTTNPQQWALQAMFGAAPISSYGWYRTLELWGQAASVVMRRVYDAGADPSKPIRLVGHSYGGAVASILAARFRFGQRGRTIQLLTFGCPKPGDDQLARWLSLVDSVHLVNHDDPVTYLTPSGVELAMLEGLIPTAVQDRWGAYRAPAGRIQLSASGVREGLSGPSAVYPLLFRLTTQAITSQAPEALTAHNMFEYRRRIVCPGHVAPSPPPGSPALWLRPDELAAPQEGSPLTYWPNAPFTYRAGKPPTVGSQPVHFLDVASGQLGGLWNGLSAGFDTCVFDTLTLAGDFGAYLVGRSYGTRFTGPCIGYNDGSLFAAYAADGYHVQVGGVDVLFAPWGLDPRGLLWIVGIRRTGLQWQLSLNGVVADASVSLTADPLPLGLWFGTRSLLPSALVWMPEVRVYDRAISDTEDSIIYGELVSRYPPP